MKKGNPRGGYNPKTAAATEMKPKPPVRTDAKLTSLDAERKIARPPAPFTAPMSLGQSPPGTKAPGGVSTLEPKIASGLKRSTVTARALPPASPVGQKKPINQSGQIGGRMGFPPPKRKAGAYPSGYKSKKGAAFYGEA